MNKEEKEQWLYEMYNYTSNFDFSRLDKYEEVNNDICIDTLILDYTMLYEFYKEEIKNKDKVVNYLLKRISNLEFEVEDKNRIINELEKLLDENVELNYVHNGKRQFNKTLTAGGLLFRDYIKEKLQELKENKNVGIDAA